MPHKCPVIYNWLHLGETNVLGKQDMVNVDHAISRSDGLISIRPIGPNQERMLKQCPGRGCGAFFITDNDYEKTYNLVTRDRSIVYSRYDQEGKYIPGLERREKL